MTYPYLFGLTAGSMFWIHFLYFRFWRRSFTDSLQTIIFNNIGYRIIYNNIGKICFLKKKWVNVLTGPRLSKPFRVAISWTISFSTLRWNRTKNEFVNTLLADEATKLDSAKKQSHDNNISNVAQRCQ